MEALNAGADADGGDAPRPAEAARAPPERHAPAVVDAAAGDDDADAYADDAYAEDDDGDGGYGEDDGVYGGRIDSYAAEYATPAAHDSSAAYQLPMFAAREGGAREGLQPEQPEEARSSPPAFPACRPPTTAGRSLARSRARWRRVLLRRPAPRRRAARARGGVWDNITFDIPQLGVGGPNSAPARGPNSRLTVDDVGTNRRRRVPAAHRRQHRERSRRRRIDGPSRAAAAAAQAEAAEAKELLQLRRQVAASCRRS